MSLLPYLAQDRRRALAQGVELPEQAEGAALFADLSGFTALTEALARAHGPRRGAEAVTRQINQVYGELIRIVENWRGSVVGFAGDAITCWFDEADGPGCPRAAAAALAMQATMRAAATVPIRRGVSVTLALKVAVACGPVHRWAVGDGQAQRFDVLAGATLMRAAALEQLSHPGEVLLEAAAASALGDAARLGEHRRSAEGLEAVLLEQFDTNEAPGPWPTPADASPEALRPWLLPAVFARDQVGLGAFLTELRPAVPLFARFAGIDYDRDPTARARLDTLVRAAQQTLARYDGTLLQITIGDKGSSLYALFGAPVTHEDDATRAVLAALDLQRHAARHGLPPLQIGLGQGALLVGAVGGPTRQSYTAIGDAVNLAARLMEHAAPGETLLGAQVRRAVADRFALQPRPPLVLKGRAAPEPVFVARRLGKRAAARLIEPCAALPLIGRGRELDLIEAVLEHTLAGRGQVVGVEAEAGMGKSRLVAEAVRLAQARGLTVYGAACHATGTNTPYLVWGPIWQDLLDLPPEASPTARREILAQHVALLAPERQAALPLLGPLLDLSLPDNDFTRPLEPRDRQAAMHALLRDMLIATARAAAAAGGGLLLVIEDLHWIDAVSHELLVDLARSIGDLPVLLLLASRPPEPARAPLAADLLPYTAVIRLERLDDADVAQLIAAGMARLGLEDSDPPPALVEALSARAQGNPFYLEELLNYLHDHKIDPRHPATLAALELPESLHRLVLSRLDQLSATQQATIRAASVIGRRFLAAWLAGAFRELSGANLPTDLSALVRADLTAQDAPEPETAYMFKHVVTQEVAYSSLSAGARTQLHKQVARYLEALAGETPERVVDQLAYHYDRSDDLPRRRKYLRRAGEAAAGRFANTAALSYLERALGLTRSHETREQYELLLQHEAILDLLGDRAGQRRDLDALEPLAAALDEPEAQATVLLRRGTLALNLGDYAEARAYAEQSVLLTQATLGRGLEAQAEALWARACVEQSSLAEAEQHAQTSLRLARAAGERPSEIRALLVQGIIRIHQRALADARHVLDQALERARQINDPRLLASTWNLLGNIAMFQPLHAAAQEAYRQGTVIARMIGDRNLEAVLCNNQGQIAIHQGDYGAARDVLAQGLAIARAIGDRHVESYLIAGTAKLYDAVGDYAAAQSWSDQSLALKRALEERWFEGYALAFQGLIAHHRRDDTAALEAVTAGLAILSGLDARSHQAKALTIQGHALARLSRLDAAADSYRAALELREELREAHLAPEARAGLARVALAQGDLAAALAHAEAILPQLHPGGLEGADEPLRVMQTCADVFAAAGDARVGTVLAAARAELQRRAATLWDDAARQVFLEQVEAHRVVNGLHTTKDT
ncbi:MAG TPA: adenylate/guanylate cyclase domain-containing protein [Roseiflexaceae bacterium]|nr:adenylate/guanylate cyclase domain-containing protein [Roseiflexaceae bacterium]